jgi:hypothetical protein
MISGNEISGASSIRNQSCLPTLQFDLNLATMNGNKTSDQSTAPNTSCGCLTWKAKDQSGLKSVDDATELWGFVSTWSKRIRSSPSGGGASDRFEQFIFLWVSVNAWASMTVPDQSRNYEDTYLVHSMAADPKMNHHFQELMENRCFSEDVRKFVDLCAVIKVLWLKNKPMSAWRGAAYETRKEYIAKVFAEDPFHQPAKSDKRFPAFAPECAKEHFDKNEPIPCDWPHILHMIYQVRCNLFHGGKTYNSKTDQIFVGLSYKVLWRVWRKMFPRPQDAGLMHWDRLFIRSGIRCKQENNILSLTDETTDNIRFIREVLDEVGWANRLEGKLFRIPPELIEEQEWLDAWEKCRSGAECGLSGFEKIELSIMDTHLSGVVRWLNALGITTTISCEGHKPNARCFISLKNKADSSKVTELVERLSNGKITYAEASLRHKHTEGSRTPSKPSNDRLLKLGESLYREYQKSVSDRD